MYILQESCKTTIKKVNLARFWQKKQILQESDRQVKSCKNLARFLKDLHQQEKFLQDLHYYGDKTSAANWEISIPVNMNPKWKSRKPFIFHWDFKYPTNTCSLRALIQCSSNCIGWNPNRKENFQQGIRFHFVERLFYLPNDP